MTNTEYWAERTYRAQERITDKGIHKAERELAKQYKRTANRLIEDFLSVYKEIELMRAKGEEVTVNKLYQMEKYWKMLNRVKTELGHLNVKEYSTMYDSFLQQYESIYKSIKIKGQPTYNEFSDETMKKTIETIWCADDKMWSDRIWQSTGQLAEALNEELAYCVSTGKNPNYLKKQLQQRFNVTYSQASRIVRTEMSFIQNGAAKQRYRDYGLSKVRVWASPDERRCDECGRLHNKVYLLGQEPTLPLHPNCRCCIVPVVE